MSPLPSPGPAMVLDVLRQHADPQGHAAPGLDVLADALGYSPRQVERHLQRLRDDGLIAHVRRAGRRRPARYKSSADEPGQQNYPEISGRSAGSSTFPATRAPPSARFGSIPPKEKGNRANDRPSEPPSNVT